MIQILVDADACPRDVKELLYRVADRRSISVTLVANQYMRVPESPNIHTLKVDDGLDVADERIVELCNPGDLVITSDIPLCTDVIDKGGFVLSPRGKMLTLANIGERRAVRDIMADIRGTGVDTGGPPAYSPRDKQTFANALDRFLAKALKST